MRNQTKKNAILIWRAKKALDVGACSVRAAALLAYFVERAMLEQHGRPLSETAFYQTKSGPMGAGAYEMQVRGHWPDTTGLNEMDLFSWAELALMAEVLERFEGLNEEALAEHTQKLCPEWLVPTGETVEPLHLTTIWKAMQFDPETVNAMEMQWLSHENLSKSWEASHKRHLRASAASLSLQPQASRHHNVRRSEIP